MAPGNPETPPQAMSGPTSQLNFSACPGIGNTMGTPCTSTDRKTTSSYKARGWRLPVRLLCSTPHERAIGVKAEPRLASGPAASSAYLQRPAMCSAAILEDLVESF